MRFSALLLAASLITSSLFVTSAEAAVTINASLLRKTYLSRNIEIARALNEVYIAKAQVSQARANLLPSVNLGAILGGGQNFMLSTVSTLLPFLMPANWMDLRESNALLRAQTSSYYLAQLNGYASAYSLYATIVGDIKLRSALRVQYEAYKAIEDQLKKPAEIGMVRREDYLQAKAQTQMSLVQLSQVEELIKREKAAIRQMLGLSLKTEILFETNRVPSSAFEGYSPSKLLATVQARSPEIAQLNSLVQAAQAGSYKAAFSFLTGVSMNSSREPDGGFSTLQYLGSVNLGFGYFPALEISNLNVRQVQLQRQQLAYDQGQLVETNLMALEEAKVQYEAAGNAEETLREVYESEYRRYQAGIISMVDLLQIGNNQTNAIVSRIKAQTSIDLIRVNLHRMTIADQFKYISGCSVQSVGGKGNIFKPKQLITLEQACRR